MMLGGKMPLLTICAMTFVGALNNDDGFNLFFSTNLEEMNDVPIYFETPLPAWLRGTLVRNGLGRFEMAKRNFLHAFDAFGKLGSWMFPGNGSAYFSTRFIQSDFYKASVNTGDIAPYLMFEGVQPNFDEFQKLEALVRGIDNMNVNVDRLFNPDTRDFDYVALSDFWKIYEFNPRNLSTIGHVTADIPQGKSSGSFKFLDFLSSAHPLPEPGTTNHLTFLSSVSVIPGIKSSISLIRIKSVKNRQLVAQWHVDKVPYMHSFSVTENYAIVFASPFYVNTLEMVRYAQPINGLDWKENETVKIYVINLRTGAVTTLETDNMFYMHHVNAFEKGEEIVVDISSYRSPEFVKNMEIKILRDPVRRNNFDALALLKRYVIDVGAKSVILKHFDSSAAVPFAANLDLPTINENFRGKKYCFVYGIVLKSDNISLSHIPIVKKNVCGNSSLDDYWFEKGHYPIEAWFVARPGGKNEDDGYLLVPVLDGFKKRSYLAIIDAGSMKLLNKAYLPLVVPFGFHGRFFEGLV